MEDEIGFLDISVRYCGPKIHLTQIMEEFPNAPIRFIEKHMEIDDNWNPEKIMDTFALLIQYEVSMNMFEYVMKIISGYFSPLKFQCKIAFFGYKMYLSIGEKKIFECMHVCYAGNI